MRLKALLAAVVLTLCLSTTAAAASRVGAVFDREADCSALPPAAHSVAGITDDGHLVVIVATVLLDGIKKERASALFERANTAYEPINLRLVPTFRRVTFLPDQPATGSRRATIDTANLFAQAKDAVGGTRPEGSDLVHVLTNKDLTQGAYGNTVAGVAECAGGIQWPDKAFSASEDGPDEYSIGPPGIVRVREVPAKTIAHEIGHVLGALH
jgi:hypothetical protein